MKINAKDLCSIKDIQELKSVDSINNILKVINSEITPMSVTAQTYEELFSVIAVLKKQWNNFNSDVYFKNENVDYPICRPLWTIAKMRNGWNSEDNLKTLPTDNSFKLPFSTENITLPNWRSIRESKTCKTIIRST